MAGLWPWGSRLCTIKVLDGRHINTMDFSAETENGAKVKPLRIVEDSVVNGRDVA